MLLSILYTGESDKMPILGNVGAKVETNIKERLGSGKSLVSNEVSTIKGSVNKLFNLRPIPAILQVTVGTIDNVGRFVEDQANTTRKWTEGMV